MYRWIFIALLAPFVLFGQISIDEMMSPRQQEASGVDRLSHSERCSLEDWLNSNFMVKSSKREKPLHLSINADDGSKLELSDGSTYEVNPKDHIHTSLWITPFPLEVSMSENPDYPYLITNLRTETSVEAKQISKEEFLKSKKKKKMKTLEPAKKEPAVKKPKEKAPTKKPVTKEPKKKKPTIKSKSEPAK